MTKITQLKLMRKFEENEKKPGTLVRRSKVLTVEPQKLKIDCGNGQEFEVFVSVGQFLNRKKMCKKLLAKLK